MGGVVGGGQCTAWQAVTGEKGKKKEQKRKKRKIASAPFIFIMFIEFGSKGADIKGLLRDS